MKITVKSTDAVKYEIYPDTQTEIAQNIAFILRTLKASVPLDRTIGISGEFYGKPQPAAEALLYQEILDEIEEREPRVKVESVTFEVDAKSGELVPILEVTTNVE